jgi:hypothetical protein
VLEVKDSHMREEWGPGTKSPARFGAEPQGLMGLGRSPKIVNRNGNAVGVPITWNLKA